MPPAITSATVHAAETVTAGVSSASHARFRNIDRRIFVSLLLPGVLGGMLGATLLAHVPAHTVRPFVWAYLLATSLVVLARVILKRSPLRAGAQGPALGAVAGFLDAIGGGGWGTIVTSTMIARGVTPRYAIGTSNAVVFFVALTTSVPPSITSRRPLSPDRVDQGPMSDLPSSAELDALRLSLEVALRSVAFSLPFAVLIAWLLTRARFPGRMLFDAFVHLPLVLPPVAVGYVLLILFGVRGPIGGWLRAHFGIELAFTTAGAALATAVMTFPLLVRAIRLSLENVDRGLEEAARTLGASPLDRFVSITLPLMLPGILAGAVTAFSAGLGEFGAVITFASNVPGVTRTLPLALYTAMQSPTGDALALRLALLSFALGLAGLLAAELLVRRVRRLLGP
ncbi:MAG: molybdate ABC transporter permease subunit [Gammaproteobacteria bacterium]|nr:MAG: molybdate ABC transporter permease subunit [Gammaproteobacteria bacterium]